MSKVDLSNTLSNFASNGNSTRLSHHTFGSEKTRASSTKSLNLELSTTSAPSTLTKVEESKNEDEDEKVEIL